MTAAKGVRAWESEAELAARWGAGVRRAMRLEDGRALRVVFPGVPGGGSGPDFTGAILDAGGDLLRGDVEVHVRASGWREHGHVTDPAYGGVVLHVVGENDTGGLTTLHASGRAIAVLVLRAGNTQGAFPPPFTPPCALVARQADVGAALRRMGERRLRMKAARIAPLVADAGPGQALYTLMLEILGGSANRGAFASLARSVPLAALLEAAEGPEDRPLALTAALKGEAMRLALRRAGLRPMASPSVRLEAMGRLVARLWPDGADPGWPVGLTGEKPRRHGGTETPGEQLHPAVRHGARSETGHEDEAAERSTLTPGPSPKGRGEIYKPGAESRRDAGTETSVVPAPPRSTSSVSLCLRGESTGGRLASALLRIVRVQGIGRETAIELAVNGVLPVALAGRAWDEGSVLDAWRALPSPGTYGKLRRLEGWLGGPFGGAAELQGGLLLHADYCTKGMCGRCPVTEAGG